ncbi:MAG: Gfo/Idh/MocA family oxidoreductase [Nocardioidaceae bacterium]|nr:MAG: Gfo/Idh/MocA family oxidoreductase [Nocardioidaceae bacterium]
MRLGIVGYGLGGRVFHAPYVTAATGIELVGVVTRDQARRDQLREDLPHVPAFDTLADLARAGVDAVTITTPPPTREELVLEAVSLGLHVVADKPFAPDSETAERLRSAADEAGLILDVFHNRRLDEDFLRLRESLDSGALGRVRRFHNRFDLDDPGTIVGGPGNGLLSDLGSHLVDQAMFLFGPVESVFGRLDPRDTPEGPSDGGFVITLQHVSGVDSHLTASRVHHMAGRSMRVYGDGGAFEANSREALLGDYSEHYAAFATAVRNRTQPPVTPGEAVAVITVLDAVRESHASGQVVRLP